MSIEKTIAARYLKSKRKQSFVSLISIITVSGIALGVAALIIVLAVMAGFEKNLREKLLGNNPHILVRSFDGEIADWQNLSLTIKKIEGVKHVEPSIVGEVLGTGPRSSQGLRVKGIDFAQAFKDGTFNEARLFAVNASETEVLEAELSQIEINNKILEHIIEINKKSQEYEEKLETENNLSDDLNFNLNESYEEDAPLVLVGSDLARILGVWQLNQYFKLVSPFGRITPLGNTAPLTLTYKLGGTFQTGFVEQDSFIVYMDLEEAQKFLGTGVSVINIKIENFDDLGKVKEKVESAIGADDYWVSDWMQGNLMLFSALQLEQKAMFVILTLIILVACFSIVSTLIMMVLEKSRDIAILKSMGASRKQIRKIFTYQGLAVGLLGTALGFVLGLFLCILLQNFKIIDLPPEIYLMDRLPIEMRPLHLLLTVVVSVIMCYLATLYPASQAAKLDPVEALRYE